LKVISTPGGIFFALKQQAVIHFFYREEREGKQEKGKRRERFLYKMLFFACLEQLFVGKKSFRCSVFHKNTVKQSQPITNVIEFCCPAFSCLLSPVSCLLSPFLSFSKAGHSPIRSFLE